MFFSTVANNQTVQKTGDNTLLINGKTLSFENSIDGLAISDSEVIVLTYETDANGNIIADNVPRNNIFAYDFNGNLLWRI